MSILLRLELNWPTKNKLGWFDIYAYLHSVEHKFSII